MHAFFWILATIGALLGVAILALTCGTAISAPQEGAGAAIAVGLAVIPYVLARSLDELRGEHPEVRIAPAPPQWSAEHDRVRGAETPSRW
jgi:hypothetical protein